MGIARARIDSGGAGSAGSGGFNWQAGNLALQPQRESYTPTQQEVNTGVIQPSAPQRESFSVPRTLLDPRQNTVSNFQQQTGNFAPAPSPAPSPIQDIAPPPPPTPPVGGRQWYNSLDAGGKQAADNQWLGGDSDYTAQISEYDKALQSFIDRIAEQRKGFTTDANLATQSTERNQNMSLDNLGEDFGARGLSYSGLFDTSKNQTNQRFNEAKSGIERMRAKNDSDAVNRETDYRAENQISRNNAQRASTGRQAQRQALIDSMNGF